ncbi:isopentenyl-diphosphate Delta-isomerase [Dyadobacter pollutisoli]|jgi:isopentenyl-diphosphate delta-isomerase|uniref:Isopentenyl-diphosphate delta-isomerase n=1 Tax=Dyadobacter pollutisoli TaxID=2910158 RepID=A0A9E8NHK7_9BACT|nr:isopentenyl-diphosphate Delta-isomerase [Dyadobacter pollutisoli]WAC15126.1 isopentenyl-diphosphate Delta-isomerase [Dyadobacter pollutisoli]
MNDQVVLVNEHDVEIGLMPKLEAHQKGALHRAFSVFIFNSKGEMLLQQRAFGKYHSEGLWSNTCCSHPLPNESAHHGAVRRLHEEMGIHADLRFLFSFQYRVNLENGLTENELDHVYWGISDAKPEINTTEVSNFRYMKIQDIKAGMAAHPAQYTEWFKICLAEVEDKIKLRS